MHDTILKSYLDGFANDLGYRNGDIAKQFELFASYCVVCHGFTDKFDVEKAHVGSGNDTGIDAIAMLVNGKVCHDIAELEDFIDLNQKIDVKFIFVQAKTSQKFESGDILKFGNGVKDFFNESPSLIANEDILTFREMKDLVFKNARKFHPGNPTCELFYVTTGKYEQDKNTTSVQGTISADLESTRLFTSVRLECIDAEKLYKIYRGITRGTDKEIEMEHYIALPEVEEVQEAILGRLSCIEFLKLICDDSGIIDKNIFSDNIRDYLGPSPINAEISSTIADRNKKNYFILLNNGITAVAKKITRTKNKIIIDNIQIVNGCQTSNVLYENKQNITKDMHIPIKIVSTTNQEVINSIIRSTNRQNQVQPEAFESLTEFHRKFEEFCKAKNRDVKGSIYYERRSRQYVTDDTVRPIQIISLSNLLSASISMFYSEPHSTHRYYGELLKANRSKIFIEDHLLEPYYFAAYCLHKLILELRKTPESKKHSFARYHTLMYIWNVLTNGEKYKLNSRKLAGKVTDVFLPYVDDDNNFLKICADGIHLFYLSAKKTHIDKTNIARSRIVTEEFANSIRPETYGL